MQCEQVLEAVKLGEESQEIWDHLATCVSCRTKCESTAFVFDRADPTDKRPPAPILDARRKWLPFALLFALIPIVAGLAVVVVKLRKQLQPPPPVEVEAPRRPVTPSVTPVAVPVAAPGPEKRHVSIDATPPATLYLDGKKQGPTPFEADLPVGKLAFELKAEGYHTVRKTVQVGGDEVKLAFNLQPRAGSDSPPEVSPNDPANGLPRLDKPKKGRVLDGEVGATPPVAEKKAEPEPEPEPERPKRPVASSEDDDVPLFSNNFGFLNINCTPYAKVILDGKDIGRTTPVSRYSTSPGHHKIVLKARNGEVTVEVDVRSKQVVEIDKTIE